MTIHLFFRAFIVKGPAFIVKGSGVRRKRSCSSVNTETVTKTPTLLQPVEENDISHYRRRQNIGFINLNGESDSMCGGCCH